MANKQIRHSELTFQLMIESTPNAIVLVNNEGKIAYINNQTEKLFGYNRTDLVGQQIEKLIPKRYGKDHPSFRNTFFTSPSVRAMGAGRELFAIRENGSEFPVEIGLNPLVTADGTLVLASIIDITERKKAEERFRLVVESAPNAMLLVNKDGIITLVNAQTENFFDYEKEELIGKKLEILIPERFKNHHPQHRQNFFSSLSARSMGAGRDLYAMQKDGSEIQVEIGLNPIETDEGQMVLASIIDITERKEQEAIIKNQVNELEIKNRELEQFAYIASHDLQEPLRTLTNITELFEQEYQNQLDTNAKKYLKYLLQASARMSALVKGLLDYSRIGHRKELSTINCNIIIKEVLDDLATNIQESNACFDIEELPQLQGYSTEIHLLFQNLITNAIKFCCKDTTPKIKIAAQKENKHWLFSFQDNGIGIPGKYQKKIFVIFQRLHNKNIYEGTGIGLAHCQKIVELHGGKIWVDSEPDKGSTFYFTIPRAYETRT